MVISGWKTIAATLGVSVATAERWRLRHALPVVTLGHTAQTTEAALAAWRARREGIARDRCEKALLDARARGVADGGA